MRKYANCESILNHIPNPILNHKSLTVNPNSNPKPYVILSLNPSQNIGCVYRVYTAESLCSTERIDTVSVNFT